MGIRGYGQRDPLNEFKTESFELFEALLEKLRESVTGHLMRVELMVKKPENEETVPYSPSEEYNIEGKKQENPNNTSSTNKKTTLSKIINSKDPGTWGKIARNSPCPCNSGLKYKQCHGKNT